MRRLCAALVALLIAGTAHAATTTYWVSPTGTGGASGADSTTNATTLAWVNANAGARITAGDNVVVRFKSGAYTDPIQPNFNAVSARRISYYGFPNDPTAVRVSTIRFGWNGAQSRGDYSTARWVTLTGAMAGCDQAAGLYATGDSIVKVLIPAAGAGFEWMTANSIMDSCTFGAGSITSTGQSEFIGMYNLSNVNSNRNSFNSIKNCTFNLTINTAPPQGDVKVIGMRNQYDNVFFRNTFNITVTNVGGAGTGYFFPVLMYYSHRNSFQSNTWNLTMNATPGGTHYIWGLRDYSSFNRFVNNTVTATGVGGMSMGLTQDGSASASTRSNYYGGNAIKVATVDGFGLLHYQNGARGDTLEFNLFAGNTALPAWGQEGSFAVSCSAVVVRHNTFYAPNAKVIAIGNMTGASGTGSKFVSNIAYSTVANGANPVVSVPSGIGMDSLGVIFSRGGNSATAISYGGVTGAPGSGTTGYGNAGKALWNTPTFTDSAYATLDATLRVGSPATTATLQDGYAGAYGTASADVTAPSAISTLAAGAAAPSSIPLTWTSTGDDAGVGTATSYDVRYSTGVINAGNFDSATPFTTGVPVPQVAGTVQGVTVTGLTPGTSYQFAIKSKDEANNTSAISNVVGQSTAAAVDVIAPDAVNDLSANAASVSSIALLWTAPGDDGSTGTATTYDIRRSTTDITEANWSSRTQLTNEAAPRVAGLLEILIDSGLSQGVVYYYAMKTRDEEGNESALSNIAVGETMPDETPPSAIAALTGGSPTTTSVALEWESSGDDGSDGSVSSYILKRSTAVIDADNFDAATTVQLYDPGDPDSPYRVQQTSGERENFTVESLAPATTHYFALKACDEVPNCSDISNVISVTTGSDVDVTAPAAIATLASNAVTESSIDLTWTAPGDDASTGTATSYDIRYSLGTVTSGTFATDLQALGEPTPLVAGQTQTYTLTGLASNTTYTIAIKTLDEMGNTSAISNVLTKATAADATAPGAVSNLAVVATGNGTVTLRWTAPGDDGQTGTATSYDVRYRTGGAVDAGNWAAATTVTGEPVPSAAGSIEFMTISSLSNGTTYYFGVRAKDEATNEASVSNSPSGTPTATELVTARARRFRQIRR